MFDWKIFLLLVFVCVPGVLSLIPLLRKTYPLVVAKAPKNKPLPGMNKFILLSLVNSFVLVCLASILGTALAPKVNLYYLHNLNYLYQSYLAFLGQ